MNKQTPFIKTSIVKHLPDKHHFNKTKIIDPLDSSSFKIHKQKRSKAETENIAVHIAEGRYKVV